MNLNKKNLFGKYYNWIYGNYPNDVCSFFWGSIVILLLFPIVIPGRLLGDEYDEFGDYFGKGLALWLVIIFVTVVGLIPYSGDLKPWLLQFPILLILLIILITGALEIGLIGGIIAGILYIAEKRKKKKIAEYNKKMRESNYTYEEPDSNWDKFSNFIGAIRGKYCTRIKWY